MSLNDFMTVAVHGYTAPAPITGKGKLAARFNSPNHGLIVRSHGKFSSGVMAAAARGKAATDKAYFEFEDMPMLPNSVYYINLPALLEHDRVSM